MAFGLHSRVFMAQPSETGRHTQDFLSASEDMAVNKIALKRNPEIYERQARICKAFAHPGRLQILELLGEGERRVAELQQSLGISKTGISQHMAVLKSVGVLSTRREGKQLYCFLAMPEVKQACQLVRKVLDAQIAASQRLVA
jgi:DNA-binding transcriptional ArsR family regulator